MTMLELAKTERISERTMFENLNEYEDGQNGEAQTATPSATEEMASTQDSPYQRTGGKAAVAVRQKLQSGQNAAAMC